MIILLQARGLLRFMSNDEEGMTKDSNPAPPKRLMSYPPRQKELLTCTVLCIGRPKNPVG